MGPKPVVKKPKTTPSDGNGPPTPSSAVNVRKKKTYWRKILNKAYGEEYLQFDRKCLRTRGYCLEVPAIDPPDLQDCVPLYGKVKGFGYLYIPKLQWYRNGGDHSKDSYNCATTQMLSSLSLKFQTCETVYNKKNDPNPHTGNHLPLGYGAVQNLQFWVSLRAFAVGTRSNFTLEELNFYAYRSWKWIFGDEDPWEEFSYIPAEKRHCANVGFLFPHDQGAYIKEIASRGLLKEPIPYSPELLEFSSSCEAIHLAEVFRRGFSGQPFILDYPELEEASFPDTNKVY